jgi:hypothetical protein
MLTSPPPLLLLRTLAVLPVSVGFSDRIVVRQK